MVSSDAIVDGILQVRGFTIHACSFAEPVDVDKLVQSDSYVLTHRCVTPGSSARATVERRPGASPKWVDVGQLLFVPSGFSLRFQADAIKEKRMACFSFSKTLFEEFAPIQSSWSADNLGAYLHIRNFRIVEIMRQLREEAVAPDFGSRILCESLGQALIVELSRHFSRGSRTEDRGFPVDQASVRQIEDYIRAMCGQGTPPTIGDLATLCNVSPRHLTKNFKQATGLTVHEFVESVRLAHASDLLSNTRLPIKIIAWRTGFATASRFAASFKQSKGVTPRRFRSVACDDRHVAMEH